jgi:hypothetical protein
MMAQKKIGKEKKRKKGYTTPYPKQLSPIALFPTRDCASRSPARTCDFRELRRLGLLGGRRRVLGGRRQVLGLGLAGGGSSMAPAKLLSAAPAELHSTAADREAGSSRRPAGRRQAGVTWGGRRARQSGAAGSPRDLAPSPAGGCATPVSSEWGGAAELRLAGCA